MNAPLSEQELGAPSLAVIGPTDRAFAVPNWLLLTWLLPTVSWLADLFLRSGTLLAWPAERWFVYASTVCWGYLSWALVAMIGIRLTRKRANFGRAWFALLSLLLAASLACTWGYYCETGQYPTWSEIVFLIEESSNVEGTAGLLRDRLVVALLVAATTFGLVFSLWQRVVRAAPAHTARRRGTLWGMGALSVALWLARSSSHGMADASPMVENGPVVAGMAARYYLVRNRGVFHETQRSKIPALAPPSLRPNIVLVVNESLGRKALSLYGNPALTSPNLDRRVAEDPTAWFVFSRAVSNSSNTSVSVPTILLGLEPGSGVDEFHAAPAIWHYARAAGYRTSLLSAQSWHYASLDHFLLSDPPDRVWTAEPEGGIKLTNGGGMNDAEFFEQVEQQLASDAGLCKPFLEVIQFNATHFPFLERPESGFDVSTRVGRYNGAVQLIDKLMDRLLQSLERNGVADNTVVFITSDHGENHGEHDVHRTHSFYEEVVGIPYLIHVPEAVRNSRPADYATLRAQLQVRAQNLDIVPTLVDVMGLGDAPELRPFLDDLDGQSLLTQLDPKRLNVHRNVVPIRRWSNEGFALTRDNERYSFTEWRGDELYDLASDPEQLHDLSQTLVALPQWAQEALRKRPELGAVRDDYCGHLTRCIH